MWEDIVLMATSFLFALALLPSIFSKNKPSLWSCAFTCILLLATVWAYASLHLFWAQTGCALTLIAWIVLLWQRIFEKDV